MIIYPAIDIKDGRCVRLKQGKFSDITVYEKDPWKIAVKYREEGASHIHIVDLDGARTGGGVNNGPVAEIIKSLGGNVYIQLGGGIRDMNMIEEKIKMGVNRVILGTAAIKNPAFVKDAVREYGDMIAVGIDAAEGIAAVSGWEEVSGVSALKLALDMKALGVKTVIYTDISKDGTMAGANIAASKSLAERTGLGVITSGGVSSLQNLTDIKKSGAAGAIIGKALLSGEFSLADAINCCKGDM